MSATLAPAKNCRRDVPDGCPLTRTELAVIALLAEGLTCAQAAERMGKACATVQCHLTNAKRRLGQPNVTQVILVCLKARWVGSEPAVVDFSEVAAAVDRLARAVRDDQKRGLTATQRAYLHAFDDLLYARDENEIAAARAAMTQALGPLLDQAGVQRRSRPQRDLVERLVAYVQANRVA